MYVKTTCPCCGEVSLHDLAIHYQKTTIVSGSRISTKFVVKKVEVDDTVKMEDLVRDITRILNSQGKKNITSEELKTYFEIGSACCDDVAQMVKVAMKERVII